MANILITGANGFVGHHLVRELSGQNHAVSGVGREKEPSDSIARYLTDYISCDLTSATDVTSRLSYGNVDAVIHLAGLANVGRSFAEPAFFLSANAAMATNLLQHALETDASSRFLLVSSGAVYDNNQPMPIKETGLLSHSSPYAISKLSVEMMSDYYRGRGLEVINIRPFNHFGPGQSKGFLVPDLLARLEDFRDNGTPLVVGDLSTARDYTDVRDVVRAYITIATSKDTPNETVYNVCSGRSRTGQEVLDELIRAMGLTHAPNIEVDQKLIRPNDAKVIYGDNTRLCSEFGWKPEIVFSQTIRDLVKANK